uniref:Uncharacterized protein n=2 Tax=Human herpesvirus 1 TaxID=10298 RepID=A0A2U9A8L7_HHV1|nr:hypothetical protein [Human alphaherpesvirus 1]AWO69834.1 hypothetical protein [Human alphaherpesvirus 1]AWO70851.1 hypothetical protein [Human alphaherpesvirus 1]AWO71772.1 hypothetical protein [Human alphaherpesvirus 1]AWW08312.1 hypothetical protein [Human alphaherpesvirus 1]
MSRMLRASSSSGLRSISPWLAASVRTESQAARSSGASSVWPRCIRSRNRMAVGLVAIGGGAGMAARCAMSRVCWSKTGRDSSSWTTGTTAAEAT